MLHMIQLENNIVVKDGTTILNPTVEEYTSYYDENYDNYDENETDTVQQELSRD